MEYLSHYTHILKYIVASYERVGLEFNELKDRNIVEKLLGLLLGKYCINQVTNQMVRFKRLKYLTPIFTHLKYDYQLCPWSNSMSIPMCPYRNQDLKSPTTYTQILYRYYGLSALTYPTARIHSFGLYL